MSGVMSGAESHGGQAVTQVRIVLPRQLGDLAGIDGEAVVEVVGVATVTASLDALEDLHPRLVGTIRDRATRTRRPMIRLYADGEDLTNSPASDPLPPAVVAGQQPLRVVGAIAGG